MFSIKKRLLLLKRKNKENIIDVFLDEEEIKEEEPKEEEPNEEEPKEEIKEEEPKKITFEEMNNLLKERSPK